MIDGGMFCNVGRDLELSNRIAERNVPSAPLQPKFSIRPVSTKYALLPIVDRRAPATVPIRVEPTYNTRKVFNPGTAQAPWSGFAANVNKESELRDQFFALQRCDQGAYIPSSKSDLYQTQVTPQMVQQPFPGLFERPVLDPFNPDPCRLATHMFNNSTREAVRALGLEAAAAAARGATRPQQQAR